MPRDIPVGDGTLRVTSVESTVGVLLDLAASESSTFFYWIAVGKSHREVRLLDQRVRERGAGTLERTASYWRLRVNREDVHYDDLPVDIVDSHKRRLRIPRTQIDKAGFFEKCHNVEFIKPLFKPLVTRGDRGQGRHGPASLP